MTAAWNVNNLYSGLGFFTLFHILPPLLQNFNNANRSHKLSLVRIIHAISEIGSHFRPNCWRECWKDEFYSISIRNYFIIAFVSLSTKHFGIFCAQKARKTHTHTHTKSGNIDFVDILAAVTVKLAVCLAFVRNPICAGWICFFSHSLQFWSKNAERKTVWFIGCGRQWTRHFSIGFAILFHSRNLLHFQ